MPGVSERGGAAVGFSTDSAHRGADMRIVSEERITTKPVIFGRKELEAAQEKKQQLSDQADYEAKKK